jgi:hypothetical protein
MATLQQIKDKADAKLVTAWGILQTKEDAYFDIHRTYFGFNWTPATEVVDGVDTTFGDLQRPSRKHVAVDVSFPTNDLVPYQIQVSRHVGESEQGYTAIVRVKLLNDDVYTRARRFRDQRVWKKNVTTDSWDGTYTQAGGDTVEEVTGWVKLETS